MRSVRVMGVLGAVGGGLALGCSSGERGAAPPSLQQVPDSVAREVVDMLPEGARLARPVMRGDVGLGDSFVVMWSLEGTPGFAAGVVAGGLLHPLPELSAEQVPLRIGGVMVVQADADPAGELVILLDHTQARPERRMTPSERPFDVVVIDHGPAGFVRVAELEAAVAGLSRPNEIQSKLTPSAGTAG